MRHFGKENWDRTCVLLRKGDLAILQAAYPRTAGTWIREMVSRECDKLLRQQRKAARERRRRAEAIIHDPNF